MMNMQMQMQREAIQTAEAEEIRAGKWGPSTELARRLERARRDYADTLRGTHRQKVKRLFHDEVLVRAVQSCGTHGQRRAAERAVGLRRRGRTRVP